MRWNRGDDHGTVADNLLAEYGLGRHEWQAVVDFLRQVEVEANQKNTVAAAQVAAADAAAAAAGVTSRGGGGAGAGVAGESEPAAAPKRTGGSAKKKRGKKNQVMAYSCSPYG